MFEVRRRFTVSAAHQLDLTYPSKCAQLHGHNWQIEVVCRADCLDENGMVVDFAKMKSEIQGRLDHTVLNRRIAGNPTAENIARYVGQLIGDRCTEVRVEEAPGSVAIWTR